MERDSFDFRGMDTSWRTSHTLRFIPHIMARPQVSFTWIACIFNGRTKIEKVDMVFFFVIFRAANFMVSLLWLVKKSEWQNLTVPRMFQETAKKFPDKVMFYFEDEQWTFKQVDEYSNKVANYFSSLDFKKGDTIALFMENRPEYVATWLGLAKIGAIPALINYNLKQK